MNTLNIIIEKIGCRPLCFVCVIFLLIQFVRVKSGSVNPSDEAGWQEGTTVQISGILYQKEIKSNYQFLYLKQCFIQGAEQSGEFSQIILKDDQFIHTEIGNVIQSSGTIELFEPARNPGNFDARFYYQKQGVSFAVRTSSTRVIKAEVRTLRENLWQLRQRWHGLLIEAAGEKAGGILASILLAEKSTMDEHTKELYQKTGIGHILAISGLHISFIGLGVFWIFRKIGLPIWLSGIMGALLLIFYLMMIGIPISALRAVIMYILRMGAMITGRKYDAVTSLALAAAIIVGISPLYLLDAGFLLSFGAILGIITILPLLEEIWPCRYKWFSGFYVSISANLVLLPILLYFYFEFPLYSLFLNLVVIPLMSVIMTMAMAGSLLFCFIPAPGGWLLKGCKIIFALYEHLGNLCMKLPVSRIVLGQPQLWRLILYYLIIAGIFSFLKLRQANKQKEGPQNSNANRYLKVMLILCIGAALVILPGRYSGRGQLQIVMLDVGQGDGIFMRGPEGTTYFIDGGSSSVSQVGKYRMEPFLKSQGVGSLDYVFISHGDTDHLNGIKEMLERGRMGVPINNLVLSPRSLWDETLHQLAERAAKAGTKVYEIEAGQTITEKGLTITCIQPDETYAGDIGNASSMVLSVSYGQFDMLLTGDVEGEGEILLEETLKKGQYDVLKVSHHGSKNSTDAIFLEKTMPAYALISAGVKNSYGHPHEATIKRLEDCGSQVVTTPKSGAVEVITDGANIQISGFLD